MHANPYRKMFQAFKTLDKCSAAILPLSQALMEVQVKCNQHGAKEKLSQLSKMLVTTIENETYVKTRAEKGRALGDLTALQAIYRPFKMGETRQALASKVKKGLKRKPDLSLDPRLSLFIDSLSRGDKPTMVAEEMKKANDEQKAGTEASASIAASDDQSATGRQGPQGKRTKFSVKTAI